MSDADITENSKNPGCALDLGWVNSVKVNLAAVNRRAAELSSYGEVKDNYKAAWLLRAVTCIDLTTLSGDDTWSNVTRLCAKASQPVSPDIIKSMGFSENDVITTAAVCVYPARVADAVAELKCLRPDGRVKVAAVATGFPSGQYPIKTRLEEIRFAVAQGASEIDVVVDRSLVLTNNWEKLYQEIQQMSIACGSAHLKVILAVGELGSMTNIYKASLVAMMAGADFIKTSTGKEAVNATIPISIVMCRAIRDFNQRTGYEIGFKPAGGIRTAKDALNYLVMMKEELGTKWMFPNLFRIGASGLLTDIECHLYEFVTGKLPNPQHFLIG